MSVVEELEKKEGYDAYLCVIYCTWDSDIVNETLGSDFNVILSGDER